MSRTRICYPFALAITFEGQKLWYNNQHFGSKNRISLVKSININEIKRLVQAFNLMISDLKSNRVDLEHANDQLDKRRNTNFLETFPEYEEFYNYAKGIYNYGTL